MSVDRDTSGEIGLFHRAFGFLRKWGGITLIICLFVLALAKQLQAGGGDARSQCFAIQRTIAGAIEMYNLDKNTRRSDVGPAFFKELTQGGYLKEAPQDPEQGPASESNYQFIAGGIGIKCVIHGQAPRVAK